MALNKVKIKNTESIRLVTGDKTEISGGSSFNGIEIVGVTNSADATQVTNKTSLTIHSRVPGISFSVATNGITAEIEAFPVADPDEEEMFNRIAGDNHLYYFTTISGALNVPEASAAGEFIFNADRREISIHALDLNNRPAGKQSFSAAAEIFNGVILASRTDASGENVFEEHTITYNNPSYNGTKFDIEDVTITNGTTLENWYGGTRPVLVTVIPDSALLGATEVAARTAFVFPDGCSAQSIVASWNGMTCEVTFDHYVADINGITGPIDTSGLTFNFAGVSASGDITTNKLIFGDGTEMSTASSGSGGVTSINDVVASFNGLTGAVTLSAGTGITLTGSELSVDAVTSVNGASGDVTITTGSGGVTSINDVVASFNGLTGAVTLSAGTGITLTGSELNVDAVTSFNGSSGDVTYLISAGTGITLTGTELNVDAVTSFNGSSGDVTLTAGTGITLTGSELNVDAVTSFNGSSGDVTYLISAGTGITLIGTELNVDAVTSFNGSSGDVTLTAGTGITLTGSELNVDAVTSFNGASGDVTLTAGTGITLTGSELNVDAVTSINGISGAIDTSGLTFDFAGISASGDVRSPHFYGIGHETGLDVDTNNTLVLRAGNNQVISASTSKVQVKKLLQANELIHAEAGISLDTFGITFADGTFQSTASSGSGGVTSINDVVASLNGLTGAIDTSGLTFDFAGISASGDITVGSKLQSPYGHIVFLNTRTGIASNTGYEKIHVNNTEIKFLVPIELDSHDITTQGLNFGSFGITFADGTYQDTASSGSGGVTSINDVVASLNGLTGAIDTSGLTFDFAGLSASGDLTVGGAGTFGDSIVIPNGQYIYNNQSSSLRPSIRLATSEITFSSKSSGTPGRLSVANSQVKVSNFPFVSEQLINAQAGISMDTAGITFSDGLEQIQASHSFVGAGFDGQGATLQANTVLVPVEQAGSIRSATIVGDVSGSLSVSIFKYGVTSDTADLGASAEVGTISLLEKIIIRDTTEITGTTADIAEGDILAFSLGATAAGAPIIASQKATCKLKIHDK